MTDAAARSPRFSAILAGWRRGLGGDAATDRAVRPGRSSPGEVVVLPPGSRLGRAVGVQAPSRLVQVYAISLLEVGLRAESLALGERRPAPTPLPLTPFLSELLDLHAPVAASAGLQLSGDLRLATGAACLAEPVLLRTALTYLLLRALVGEPEPGHVRVSARASTDEVELTLQSRADTPSPAAGPSGDVAAVGQLLDACGARLSIDAPEGGYQPLTLSLRAA